MGCGSPLPDWRFLLASASVDGMASISWAAAVAGRSALAFAFVCLAGEASAQCTSQWSAGDPFVGLQDFTYGEAGECLTQWDPDGAGPATPKLVVGGRFSAAGSSASMSIASP